jgi:hypothetical protein
MKLRRCTKEPHYHLLIDEKWEHEDSRVYESAFSPFYLGNDGLWRSSRIPSAKLDELIAWWSKMQIDEPDEDKSTPASLSLPTSLSFRVVAHNAPEYTDRERPHIHDPEALLQFGAPTFLSAILNAVSVKKSLK